MRAARARSSFRDPSGHVFFKDGVIYRQINPFYKDDYDSLMGSGLYDALVESGLMVPHQEVDLDSQGSAGAYRIIKPDVIPFISYPYEWSFSQLKNAALATLDIQKKALEFGMTLKDSSAYNIQFFRGKPLLIDTLSFQKYQDGAPWVAYRQFCQHFLAPLALMSYKHVGLGQLSRIYIDGIPLELAHSLLPWRTRFSPAMQIHVHLHAKFQNDFGGKGEVRRSNKRSFGTRAFLGLIDSLESAVRKLRWEPSGTEWADYYEDDSYTPEAFDHKVELVTGFLREVGPASVWDLGANTGVFSRIAGDMGIQTVSFDGDPAAVERNYLTTVERGETNVLPLQLDLTNPSPRIGWSNAERMELSERGPADMVLALAIVHHLAISGNVPLAMIAEFFRGLCNWAVVEFVPKHDKKVARLLATREDVFSAYTQGDFEEEFSRYFEITNTQRVVDSDRTLYLMRGK